MYSVNGRTADIWLCLATATTWFHSWSSLFTGKPHLWTSGFVLPPHELSHWEVLYIGKPHLLVWAFVLPQYKHIHRVDISWCLPVLLNSIEQQSLIVAQCIAIVDETLLPPTSHYDHLILDFITPVATVYQYGNHYSTIYWQSPAFPTTTCLTCARILSCHHRINHWEYSPQEALTYNHYMTPVRGRYICEKSHWLIWDFCPTTMWIARRSVFQDVVPVGISLVISPHN